MLLRNWLIVLSGVSLFAMVTAPCVTAAPIARPDIIVILADDVGASIIGPEKTIGIPTPTIDSIAARGITFTQGYGTPLCIPSRVELLTGRYAQRYGIYANDPRLPTAALTMAERLRSLGYRTAAVGKWHLGMNPLDHGFDQFYGYLKSAPPYLGTDPANPLMRNRNVAYPNNGYVTDIISTEAMSILKLGGAAPRFLYLSFTAPHEPLLATPELLAAVPSSIPANQKLWAAVMIGLDRAIKRVLDVLKPGTLVIFMGDNGTAPGTNLPLRGGKQTLYEGGLRVPFMLMQTGTVASGQARSVPVSLIDIVPTVLAAAKSTPTADLDGYNLLGDIPADRSIVFSDIANHGDAIRQGPWKLLQDYDGNPRQLYNLITDRGETNNLAATELVVADQLATTLQAIKASWQPGP